MQITSSSNEKIKYLKKLLSKRSFRESEGCFVLEGARAVKDAAKAGASLCALFVREGEENFHIESDVPTYIVAPHVFEGVAETKSPQGVLATVKMPQNTLSDLSEGCVIFCENLQDPGNLGTVIRTAAAVGAAGVVLSEGCVDLFNPKVVRSTMSALFSLPVVTGAKVGESFDAFRQKGYRILGAALSPKTVDLYEEALPPNTLFVIGNEGNGITEETLSLCDQTVKIPMPGNIESLNASVAAAILMYEHYRQNR